jgi:hypothetical protein
MAWQHSDIQVGLTATFYTEAAVVGTTPHYYHRDIANGCDVVLTYDNYLAYYVAAMAAAKTITLNAIVERIVGQRTDEGE